MLPFRQLEPAYCLWLSNARGPQKSEYHAGKMPELKPRMQRGVCFIIICYRGGLLHKPQREILNKIAQVKNVKIAADAVVRLSFAYRDHKRRAFEPARAHLAEHVPDAEALLVQEALHLRPSMIGSALCHKLWHTLIIVALCNNIVKNSVIRSVDITAHAARSEFFAMRQIKTNFQTSGASGAMTA